jgi:hypothetical protein
VETKPNINEPAMKISNDNGKTFGEKIMLSVIWIAKPGD